MANGKCLTTEEKKQLAQLFVNGVTYREIAKEMEISSTTVTKMINRDKVTKEFISLLDNRDLDDIKQEKENRRSIKQELMNVSTDKLIEMIADPETPRNLIPTLLGISLKFVTATDNVEVKERQQEAFNKQEKKDSSVIVAEILARYKKD